MKWGGIDKWEELVGWNWKNGRIQKKSKNPDIALHNLPLDDI